MLLGRGREEAESPLLARAGHSPQQRMLRDASDPWRFLRLVLISRVHLRKGSKILPSMDDDGMLPFRSLSLSLAWNLSSEGKQAHRLADVACNFTHFVRWRVVLPPCKKKKKKENATLLSRSQIVSNLTKFIRILTFSTEVYYLINLLVFILYHKSL